MKHDLKKDRKDLYQPGAKDFALVDVGEGPSLQIMHVGSYADEAPVLARLHDVLMPAGGWDFGGPHHEIYLSDPRRVAPDKLKTVLRQPVVASV